MLSIIPGDGQLERELVAALFEPGASGRAAEILARMNHRAQLVQVTTDAPAADESAVSDEHPPSLPRDAEPA